MEFNFHYYGIDEYIIMVVSGLPWKILDFELQSVYKNYKEWFSENYNIDICATSFPVDGHCIKFRIKKKQITDEILIAFKLRFA